MASPADASSDTGTSQPPRMLAGMWIAAGWVGVAYGIFLTIVALRSMPGEPLTGVWVGQPTSKALMALLLTLAAAVHPIVRERRWLMAALVLSAVGDFLLAIPWWGGSFVGGLGAFLLAHLCYVGALVPLAVRTRGRVRAVVVVCLACVGLLVWFWPEMGADGLTVPVTVYIAVLCAMVGAALLARLPTWWTAVGAVCFAVSDTMIAIDKFILRSEVLAVPIWWVYAMSQLLITAGFFFGRSVGVSDPDEHADQSDPADTQAE